MGFFKYFYVLQLALNRKRPNINTKSAESQKLEPSLIAIFEVFTVFTLMSRYYRIDHHRGKRGVSAVQESVANTLTHTHTHAPVLLKHLFQTQTFKLLL